MSLWAVFEITLKFVSVNCLCDCYMIVPLNKYTALESALCGLDLRNAICRA